MFTPFLRPSVPRQSTADRAELPVPFEVVADALAGLGDVLAVCAVVGAELAREGVPLGEALEALHATFATVCGHSPTFAATEALSVAWSETTLSYLHGLSCEDPLTGLASLAHLRGRLGEVYGAAARSGTSVVASHALVVVEIGTASVTPRDPFHRALRQVRVGEVLRDVLSGGETIATAGSDRVAVLVHNDVRLTDDVSTAQASLRRLDTGRTSPRLWVEALPETIEGAEALLDRLARGLGVGAAG